MHDIKALRADPAAFDAALARRGVTGASAALLEADAGLRAVQTALQAALARRNDASRAIGAAKARKDEAEANALRERIRGAGFAAYVERAQTDAGVLWRVRAGPELQRARAEALRDQLKQRLQLDGLVVPHP